MRSPVDAHHPDWPILLRAYIAGAFASRDPSLPAPVVEACFEDGLWQVTHDGLTWQHEITSDDDGFCFRFADVEVFTFPIPERL